MYFITYGGLSVYDGVIFNNYNHQNGLANELVNDVIEIGPDSILIATNVGQLNLLSRDSISTYGWPGINGHIINKFLKSKDGFLYGVADDGLFIIDKKQVKKLPLYNPEGKEIGENLNRITEWKNYFLLMPWNTNQEEKVIIYDREKQEVTGIITEVVSNTALTPHDELWLSNEKGLQSLDLHSLQNGKILLTPVTSLKNAAQLKNEDIYFDAWNGIWFYKNNEVIHISPTGQVQSISVAQGLKASRISDLIVDKEGITWMASDGNGVVKMPGTNIRILGDLIPGIRNNITVLFQARDTTWLYNMTNHSFYRIHQGEITAFPLKDNSFHVSNMYINSQALCFVSDFKIYCIEHKDLPSSYANPVLLFPQVLKPLELGAIKLTPDDYQIMYIRANDTSFHLFVLKDNRFIMKHPLSFAMDQMSLDSKGHLWVPTRDHHLLEFSLHPEMPDQYLRLDHDYADAIEKISPRSIAVDTSGNVWIGTRNNGIYRYRFEDYKLRSSTHFTTAQGLTDNFYYYLFCDHDNTIWGGSQTGLDKISFKNNTYVIENTTKSKNIFQGVYNIINASDKAIWALTSNGEIIMISLDNARELSMTPSFFITSLMITDKEYDTTATHFTYRENNLSFRVAAPSYIDEKSIMYSYQLKGSGKTNWSKPSNNALFNFINLSPGAYQLNMKADFPGTLYPSQALHYSFTIKPPFWRTWWFVVLMTTFLLAMLFMALRYYFAGKLEKQRLILENKQAMEKERTRIATDMHDDLGAGLTRIKFLSETIGFNKQLNLPVDEEINNIRTHAHDMIDKMGEIVWALNEKNDSLSDLLAYTRSYAVSYLSENGLKCLVDAPDDFTTLKVSGEFRRNIYLVVKEALHNIVKHAQANVVNIRFGIAKDLSIYIQDDGTGFDPSNIRPYSNGIQNMKKRMTTIGGLMNMNHEDGTTIILSVPLPS